MNQAAGKGTEDVSLYTHTELIFCNVDNIHVMRQSAQVLADLLLASTGTGISHSITYVYTYVTAIQ